MFFAEYEVDGEVESVHGIKAASLSTARELAEQLVDPLSKLSHRVYVLKGVAQEFPEGYTHDEVGVRILEWAAKSLKD